MDEDERTRKRIEARRRRDELREEIRRQTAELEAMMENEKRTIPDWAQRAIEREEARQLDEAIRDEWAKIPSINERTAWAALREQWADRTDR